MSCVLDSPKIGSSAATPQALPLKAGSAAEFDHSGSSNITAGCFSGAAAAPVVSSRSAGAISPEVLSISDAWVTPAAANIDRHDSSVHMFENAATLSPGGGNTKSPHTAERSKHPAYGLAGAPDKGPGISFADPVDDENRVPETTVPSPSPERDISSPDGAEGRVSLPSKGGIGQTMGRRGSELCNASPVDELGASSTTSRKPQAISGSAMLPSSKQDTGYMTSFQVPGPTCFRIKKDAFTNRAVTSVQIATWNKDRPPSSPLKQPRLQQQPQAGEEVMIQRLTADGREYRNTRRSQPPSGPLLFSGRLDGIIAAYSNSTKVAPVCPVGTAVPSGKESVVKQRGAKRARGGHIGQARNNTKVGAGVSVALDTAVASSRAVGWRQTSSSSAAVAAADKAAERTRQLEALMNAAMESPVTYEEQIRRERLAHLRVMYTVEREMAELPVDFLRAVGYEEHGIKPRLSRMCAALVKSHRWSNAAALKRWTKVLEKARAEEFAEEMLRYEHSRLFATLSSVTLRWELKQTKRRFFWWRRRARLARVAEDQDHAREASIKIQRWTQKQLASRRRRRVLERRNRRRSAIARHKADAVSSLITFEDDRRETLQRTLRLMDEKRRYEAFHRAATELQDAWLRHVGRCQILEFAEAERQELLRRRLAEQARRWDIILPMARGLLMSCLDRSQRAVLAKLRAGAKTQRLAYEAELAEHRRMLDAAHAVVAHAWRGKKVRMEFVRTTAALSSVQRAWRRAVARRKLQVEIDARVVATAERVRKARASAAVRLQAFAVNRARRHLLNKRFAARKARLDFERRNRSELASACLVMFKPSRTIREAAGKEDFEAMGRAVMPAAAVARLRASAAARGVSLSEMSATAATAQGEDGGGNGEEDEEAAMKRLSGSELARAVIKQQEAQRRAAEVLQTAWKKRKAMVHLAGLFEKRKVKLTNEKRERTAFRLQRMWAGAKLRGELALRVERTRIRIEAERDWGARKLQKLCRRRKDAKELASRFVVRKIILEQARSLREMTTAASKIQRWYCRRQAIYYNTLRVVARYQLAYKRAACAKEEYLRRREEAAVVVQLAWRRRSMRVYLCRRFEGRRARLALEKQAAAKEAAARVLQGWWRRRQARLMLRGRFAKRARLTMKKGEEEARASLEDKSSRLLQKTWTRHCEWEKMRLRFCLRRKVLDETFALEESKRLELEYMANEQREQERRLQREHEATKVKLLLEEAERRRKADEAKDYLLKAWKLGYDKENTRNYWFNHVTGESSLERPEGWVILPSERWQKQTNDKGLVFYLDLETGESHWFPPCEQCFKREGEKVCLDCEGQVYCGRCWNLEHKEEDMAGHQWKGADSGKEDLSPGERHCVDCGFRKAKWVCLQCKDPLCGECNARIHGTGHRKNHQVESYVKSKKGWQTVEGRTDNEPTYYFNATTSESTFDKPQELMLPEELTEHKRFLEYKATSEKYVKKIEKLQFQLEELMYEKDKIAYQWANAQKAMTGGEANGTGGLSLGGLKFGGGTGKKGKKPATVEGSKTPEQEEAYKKSLLISRKDKKEMGFEVKLKKEAVLES